MGYDRVVARRSEEAPLTADQAASAVQADRGTEPSTLMGSGITKPPRSAAGGIERNRKFVDSLLEGDGFELPVPRAIQARLEAKITGFGCIRRRLSAAAVGGHQLRRKPKSRNRTLIARGTGSSNPSPSSRQSVSRWN